MKKSVVFFSVLFSLCSLTMWSQDVIWSNPINGASPNSANPFVAENVKAAGITVSGIGRGTGLTGRTVVNAYSASSWTTSINRSTSDYYYFTLTPSSCSSISFTSFQYNSTVSANGPRLFELRSSLDNYGSAIGTATGTGTTISLSAANFQNVSQSITFRLYGWNSISSGSSGLFSILDFSFNGTVNATDPFNVLSESFNTANPSWTATNTSSGGNAGAAAWTYRSSGYQNPGGTTYTPGSGFILADSETQGGGTTNVTLTSPAFSTIGVNGANIVLSHYYNNNGGADDLARVESSTDGVNWTTLQTYSSDQGSSSNFSNAVVALNAAALNQPSVRIRFRYTASDDRYWAINDVTVTEYTTAPAAQIVINTQPSTQNNTVCVGQNLPTLIVSASGTGTPSYQWYYSTTANNFTGTLITGATQSTYAIPNNTTSSRYYFCQVTYGECSLRSEVSGLNVVSNGPIITTQPSSGGTTYVCEGDIYVLSVITSSPNVTYQWYSNGNNSNSGGTIIAGANGASYQIPTNVSSSLYYYCVLTNECGTSTSNVSRRVRVTVMVNEPSLINQSICINGTLNPLSVSMNGTSVTYSYAWYYNTVPVNSGGTIVTGATSAQYTPPTNIAYERYYYAVVGVNNNGLRCSISSPVSGLITVSPASIGGTINGGGLVLCSGNNSGELSLVGNVGAIANWQSSSDNGVTWNTLIGNANTYAYTNLTANTFFRATVQSGTCPSTTSSTASLTVTASPNFVIDPVSAAICNGGQVNLSLTNAGTNIYSGVIFGNDFNAASSQNQWIVTNTGNINWTYRLSPYVYGGNTYNSNDGTFVFVTSEGANGVANLTSPTYNLQGFSNVTLSYRTYYSDLDGSDFARVFYSGNGGNTWAAATPLNASVGARTNFSTQTQTIPAIYLTNNFKVRFEYAGNNDRYWAIDNVNISGTGTGFTYSWTPTAGLSSSNIANPVATVFSPAVYTGTVTNAFGCSNSYVSTIQVDTNTPTITIQSDLMAACQGQAINFTASPLNAGSSLALQWKVNGQNVPNQTSSSFVASNLSNGDVVSCQLIATNACGQSINVVSESIAITINPSPVISITGNTTGCGVVNLNAIGANTYLWNGGNTPGTSENTFDVSGSYSVVGTSLDGCTNSQNVNVTVNTSTVYFADADGDLFGDPDVTQSSCVAIAGYVTNGLDCNDDEVLINPSATEECNGLDDDCNGIFDDELPFLTYFLDGDADDFGNPAVSATACTQPVNYVEDNTDCDDSNGLIYPGAIEICNEADDDCDNQVDENVLIVSYEDIDGDGFGDPQVSNSGCTVPSGYVLDNTDCDIFQFTYDDIDNDGFGALPAVACGVIYDTDDCDPTDPNINPAAQEECDGIDNNCDGLIDFEVQLFIYVDNDGDGFGETSSETLSCDVPVGYSLLADDCDDNNVDIFPLNPEICDAWDNDCNGLVNDGINITYYVDGDGDGFGFIGESVEDCSQPNGYVEDNSDCDDNNELIGPGQEDICGNSIDEDCDGVDLVCPVFGCTDPTANNYNDLATIDDGSCTFDVLGCTDPGANNYNDLATIDDGSCTFDVFGCTDPTANNYNDLATIDDGSCTFDVFGCTDPGANNYNDLATIDDGSCTYDAVGCIDPLACNFDPIAVLDDGSCIFPASPFVDCDGNCFNDGDQDGVCAEEDCDDANAAVNFNVLESCNGIDDNCDGGIDEGFEQFDYFSDSDLDGYGDAFVLSSCENLSPEYSVLSGDCNDGDASINPGASENCNNQDDNCDGNIDEGFVTFVFYPDMDGDGFGDDNGVQSGCQIPVGFVLITGDCDDNNAAVFSGATEICDGVDNDCDGQLDEGLSSGSVTATNINTEPYPICLQGVNLVEANLNNGIDSPITSGAGLDLWYKLTAETNVLRVSLSAATGSNALELYRDYGTCLVLLDTEFETGVSNQIMYNDELEVGGEYFVACRAMNGPSNVYSKLCFNHFGASTCDHSLSNNTGIYAGVCASFKVEYKGNAMNYLVNVNTASQQGVALEIEPWTYMTPTSSQVISRLSSILPPNYSTSPIAYGVDVDVLYALPDAAGNMESFMARGGIPCQITLNVENAISLRSADRCPALKSITSTISTDRQVCGAIRYDWKFIKYQPTLDPEVIVEGAANTNVLILSSVPGMSNNSLYKVYVRPVFANGLYGNWGPAQCLKTTSSGMIMNGNQQDAMVAISESASYSLFPNPSMTDEFIVQGSRNFEGVVEVVVFDLLGNEVVTSTTSPEGSNLIYVQSTRQLAKGVYLVRISNEGVQETLRWVRQ